MAELFAGTSGWAYPSWKPAFYPEKLAQSKFLEHYSRRLNTVEVNYTFRHRLTEKTVQSWLATTPENFQFGIKAHQAITHFARLRDVAELTREFLKSIEPFLRAGRLGPVLFQTPESFKCDLSVLTEFLRTLPKQTGYRFAFEFRNRAWFDDKVFNLLRESGAALCVAESDELAAPDIQTAPFRYYRFRRTDYSKDELAQLRARVRQALDTGADVYCYFKHEDDPTGAVWAEEMLKSIRGQAARAE